MGPLQPHSATPAELARRLAAERTGAPFLIYRDGLGEQVIADLGQAPDRVAIGRASASEICLAWDAAVSRTHARLERAGPDWILSDAGLSRHGTFVNGERVHGERRLADGDVIFIGDTTLAFVAAPATAGPTGPVAGPSAEVRLTPAQRRVLVALCRPFKDAAYASPAGNRQIAAELVVSADAVKARLRELFDAFAIADLPQNEKRAALATEAMRRGVVTARELSAPR